MKQKILAGIATGLIIFSGIITPLFGFFFTQFQTPVAQAQYDWGNSGSGQFQAPSVDNVTVDPNQGGSNPTAPDTNSGQTITTTPEQTPEQTPEEKKAAADAKAAAEQDALDCGGNPVCNVVKILTSIFMYPSFLFAAMGGLFMDYVIWGTINSTSYSDGTDGNQSGIGSLAVTGWKLVRDITNILFIFALFVVGFNLILNRESANERGQVNSFGMDPKRTLARVILMALLVNFSFFIGKTIITTANVAALVFFNKIDTPVSPENPNGTSSGGDISTLYGLNYFPGIKSISLRILGASNPQSLVLSTTGDSGSHFSVFGYTLWGSYDWSTYVLMVSITGIVSFFNFFLCYLFFSIAFLLLGRTLGLVMALIVSPLAFVSFAIPSLEDKPYIGFSDWFSQFVGLAVTAPIFLLFMYLVLRSLEIPLPSGGNGFFAAVLFIMIKLSFTAGLLLFAKRITKNLAGRVGAIATKVATSVVVNAAIIGSAAATGGASAAMFAARRQATQGAISAGNSILGSERTEALQKRMGGLRNFRTLPSSPRDAALGIANIVTAGSGAPGKINDGITRGQVYGRAMNIKNIREERLAKEAAAEAAAAQKKAAGRVTYNYDARKTAQDLRDAQKAKGGTPATIGDGRAKAPVFTQTQTDRIKKKLAENQAKIAAIAAKKKGSAATNPTLPQTTIGQRVAKIDEALKNREKALSNPALRKDEKASLEQSFNRLEAVKKNLLGQTSGTSAAPAAKPFPTATPPQNNIPPIPPTTPPTGGTSPVKPPVPPIGTAQPTQAQPQQAAQAKTEPSAPTTGTITGGPQTVQTKVGPRPGQTEPTDGTTRPKNAFSGDANFDRPKAQLVDPSGNPVSSASLAQKEESQRLADQYRKDTAPAITQIENLSVKATNLNIEGGGASAPHTFTPPTRSSSSTSTGSGMGPTPRDHATSLLSNISMPPRAGSSVNNYTSNTFAPTPAATPKPSGLLDASGKLINSTTPKPNIITDIKK